MTDGKPTDGELETLFAQARRSPAVPAEALIARVTADALAVQPKRRGGWRGWLKALGGAPGLGGLVTATCVGFWLGAAPPQAMPDLAGQMLGEEVVEDVAVLGDGEVDPLGFGWDSEEG